MKWWLRLIGIAFVFGMGYTLLAAEGVIARAFALIVYSVLLVTGSWITLMLFAARHPSIVREWLSSKEVAEYEPAP